LAGNLKTVGCCIGAVFVFISFRFGSHRSPSDGGGDRQISSPRQSRCRLINNVEALQHHTSTAAILAVGRSGRRLWCRAQVNGHTCIWIHIIFHR